MSLYSALQVASNSLQANQIGLQVVGQNIANANTPAYSREEVVYVPAPTQQLGSLFIGLGVKVEGVIQKADQFLNERYRAAISDTASSAAQESTYKDLEALLGVLNDSSISSSLTKFFNSIGDVLNQPQSLSARNLATLNGENLTGDIKNLSMRVRDLQGSQNSQLQGLVKDTNTHLETIRKLNLQISSLEGGAGSSAQAVGLRDRRDKALQDLSQLIGIQTQEQPSGALNVFHNGEFLVFEGESHPLSTMQTGTGKDARLSVVYADTGSPLSNAGGQIAGVLAARDDILGAFLTKLDSFAKTLSFEFNKIFSSGQGLTGYTSLTSLNPVSDIQKPLDSAGLANVPISGGFDVLVKDQQTGLTQTSHINIDLNGLNNNDTTLQSLKESLTAIEGLSVSVNTAGELSIQSASPNFEFAFANDTSGTLAALGINTFFTGSSAQDLGVSGAILDDPNKFASSLGGVGNDTEILKQLAGFLDKPLDALGGDTISQSRDRLVAEVTEASAATTAVADGFRAYESSLQTQQSSISGVNLDEEAVKMMQFQRSYQFSAKFISTINEMLEMLGRL